VYTLSPKYVAVTVRVPTASDAEVNVATPPLIVAEPIVVPSTEKLTVPVAAFGVTVAAKVTV
jgi:hypothetical protein